MQEDTQLVSKSMDCLRILTTSNEANKEAIFQTPSSLSTLMKHMSCEGDLVGLPTLKTSHYVSFHLARDNAEALMTHTHPAVQ